MLLLNITTDLYHYWPVLLLTGAMVVILILISVFMYIDHNELAKERTSSLTTPTVAPLLRKSKWQRFMKFLGIDKEASEEEVEEYNDMSSKFQFVGILALLIAIVSIIYSFDFGSITLPPWLSTLLTSWWFWIGLILLVILIAFRKSIFSKVPSVSWNKKLFQWIAGFVGLGLLTWFILIPYVIPYIGGWFSRGGSTSNSPSDNVVTATYCPNFNLNGTNVMSKGEWFKYDVNWDDPAISFDPEGSDTTVLSFKKHENPTRAWTLRIWKNSAGEKKWKFYPRHPLFEALVGTTYVKSAKADAIVVVSQIIK